MENYNYFTDAFGIPIVEKSKVLFMDCYGDGDFCGYMKGEVRGFTHEFVKIIPTNFDRYNSCSASDRVEWIRKPHKIVVLNN